MGDQKEAPVIEVGHHRRVAMIHAAIRAEEDRIMRGMAELLDRERVDEEYVAKGYEMLQSYSPTTITDERWKSVTGLDWVPGDGSCRSRPYSCCGYCGECYEHHKDAETDDVCDKGHCHSCEHVCND